MTFALRAAYILALLVASALPSQAQPPAQTRPWRIGIAGAYCNGYWGMLASYGLPRERLREERVSDPSYLRRFSVVLLGAPMVSASAAAQAIEDFVYNGGIAVTELQVAPSTTALPGARIDYRKGPNLQFTPTECPLRAEVLPTIRLSTSRQPAMSIIPRPGHPETYVLARFTDEGAADDVKGVFLDGNRGSPAVILFKYGAGWWLWFGTWPSYWTALASPVYEPIILEVLRYVTGGELVSHWMTGALDPRSLLTLSPLDEAQEVRPPGVGDPSAPPEDYQVADDDRQQGGDFDLLGKLPHGAEAEVLMAYWNAKSYRVLRFDRAAVRIVRVEDGQEREIAARPLDGLPEQAHTIHLKRRRAQVFLRLNGKPWLSATDGPDRQGLTASRGLQEVDYQPFSPPSFDDDFMRKPEEPSEWQVLSGTWQVQQDKGDRDAGVVSTSANPFRYESHSGEGEGRAVVGFWAWDDYHLEAAVRPTCAEVALLAHYQAPDDYLALRVPVAKDRAEQNEARLTVSTDGAERTLATTPAVCAWDQWSKLAIRVSGGYVQGFLDGRMILQALDPVRGCGQAGLALRGGKALWDDVAVRPWEALPQAFSGAPAANWEVEGGTCESSADPWAPLAISGNPEARVLSAWVSGSAYRCWGYVRPASASEAGLYLSYAGPGDHYLLVLRPSDRATTRALLTRSFHNQRQTLGERLLPGGGDVERLVQAALTDEHLTIWIDGEKVFDLVNEGPGAGRFGMYVQSSGPAYFRRVGAFPIDPQSRLVDDLTPGFAGIIDRHTWARKANFLLADPDDLSLFWHRGEFVGEVTMKVGLRKQEGQPATVASWYLGDGAEPSYGYELRFTRTWGQEGVSCELFRLGQKVAAGTGALPADQSVFVAEGARYGETLVMRINGQPALRFSDPTPLTARRLGLKVTGSPLYPDDTRIETPHVRVYTFAQAATDWKPECGKWEVASRWSCSPGWTWFAGWDDNDAWTTNIHSFIGDHRMDMFVGAKMVELSTGRQETLRDIRLGLCTTPGDVNSGYRFRLQVNGAPKVIIEKNGQIVASTDWNLPQGSLHNDWTLVSAVKRDSAVWVEWEGHQILRYEDPEPLSSGHPAIGTFHNGILTPKVTIYGRVVTH